MYGPDYTYWIYHCWPKKISHPHLHNWFHLLILHILCNCTQQTSIVVWFQLYHRQTQYFAMIEAASDQQDRIMGYWLWLPVTWPAGWMDYVTCIRLRAFYIQPWVMSDTRINPHSGSMYLCNTSSLITIPWDTSLSMVLSHKAMVGYKDEQTSIISQQWSEVDLYVNEEATALANPKTCYGLECLS